MTITSNNSVFVILLGYFRLGLSAGFLSKEEVIAWADHTIVNAETHTLPFIIFDLSLAQPKSNKAIIALISAYIGLEIHEQSGRLALHKIFTLYKTVEPRNLSQLQQWLGRMESNLTEEETHVLEEIEFWIGAYDIEEYNSALRNKLKTTIFSFLELYEHYVIQTPEKWAALDESILTKLIAMNPSF